LPGSILERHGVAEILFAVRNPAAIKANKLGGLGQPLDLIKLLIARQNTQVTGMVSITDESCHFLLLQEFF
jgi:hypothetical protein